MAENDFWPKVADDSTCILWVENFVEILHRFQDNCVFVFDAEHQNKNDPIFGKKWQMTLHIPCGLKISLKSFYLALFQR